MQMLSQLLTWIVIQAIQVFEWIEKNSLTQEQTVSILVLLVSIAVLSLVGQIKAKGGLVKALLALLSTTALLLFCPFIGIVAGSYLLNK